MERGETITIKKWIGVPKDKHSWAFYYYLKDCDDVKVKFRIRGSKMDIMTREKQIYEMDSSS